MDPLKMYLLSENGDIPASYVSLPEGIVDPSLIIWSFLINGVLAKVSVLYYHWSTYFSPNVPLPPQK